MSGEVNNRKTFSEEQESMIEQLRKENHSVHSIAAMMMVGQERVRRFLKQKNLDVYQPSNLKKNTPLEIKIIEVDYPDYSLANCKKYPVEQFFPEIEKNSRLCRIKHQTTVFESIQICMSCKIQESCLEYALKAEPYGIWGGTTDVERVYLRQKLDIKCLREVQMNRFNRKTRLNFISPSMAPHYEEQYRQSKAVDRRLIKNV